jgi:chromate transporter
MMHEEVVNRRRWLSRVEFLDLLGATNLIPGPNSSEMAIHLGYRRGGWPGLVIAGLCFIVPPAMLVSACAWAYVTYGALPEVGAILYGVKPAIVAVVAGAIWELGKSAIKNSALAVVGLGGVMLGVLGLNELLILFIAAAAGALWAFWRRPGPVGNSCLVPPLLLAVPWSAGASAQTFSLGALLAFFLKVGSVLFGSGYVLLAFLRADLVDRWHWLTEAQLLDAIAIGQMTPGPVFTTATFVGYVLAGPAGATVATVGIFLPAFVFVAASGVIIPRIRRSATAAAVLDGVNAASLSLMVVVAIQLGRVVLADYYSTAIAVLSAGALLRWRPNPAAIVLLGALAGLGVEAFGLVHIGRPL